MTAVRSKSWKSLAFVTALMTILALVPLSGVALADPDNTTPTLDITAETATNALGAFHTLTATVGSAGNHEIDFEIDCTSGCTGLTYTRAGTTGNVAGAQAGGTTVFPPDTPTDGDQTAGTVDDTRDSPELSCNTNGGTTCQVSYSRSGTAGTDLIAGWVDQNKTNESNDSDVTEGRDEATAPGATTEPDDTDVVEKTWFTAAAANVRLDCDDDDTTDTETNPPGQAEVYTCFAFNSQGTASTTDDTPVSGQVIDGENLNGANDPDNSAAAGTADYNNACTTGADGKCTYTLNPGEGETGVANVCFWIDEDNDTGFDPAGSEFDGGACAEGATADEYPATSPPANKTDVVQKTWATPAATNLDATPERDSNVKGTSHTVSATVTDQFGAGMANILVDFTVTGANAGAGCNNVPTNSTGVATCTYTDSTTVTGPEPEQDTINVAVDGSGASDATVDEVDTDLADQVEKFWFTTLPTANELVLDADTITGGCETTDATAENSATTEVETEREVCVTAYSDAAGTTVLAGKEVTLTISGPGDFYNDANDNDALDVGEAIIGKTTTVTTAANGQARADIYSTEAGSSTVTATADAVSDSVTEVWTAGDARNITCTPETATNPAGTQHVVTCLVTDVFGNPTQDSNADGAVTAADTVTFTESGPGFIVGTNPAPVDANGEAEIRTETGPTETGTETITAELAQDVVDVDGAGDLDDPCDQAAGTTLAQEPGGAGTGGTAPAGNCEDSVEKEWVEEQPPAQCADGVDNDGDGWVDFPDDPGCADAADDDESNEPIVTNHARTAEITKFKHIDLPGKKKPALMVKGVVTVDDGFDACANQVPVKVQIRASGEWITRKTDSTSENGVFKVLVRHVHAKYRVVAPRVELADEHGDIDNCLKAKDTAKYSH